MASMGSELNLVGGQEPIPLPSNVMVQIYMRPNKIESSLGGPRLSVNAFDRRQSYARSWLGGVDTLLRVSYISTWSAPITIIAR